ncbi:unnamed protein product, partial [Effrenium voratum]
MVSGAEEEEKQLEKTQEEEESRAHAQENETAIDAVGASQFLAVGASQFLHSLLETGTWSEEESQEVLAALQPLSASEVMELGGAHQSCPEGACGDSAASVPAQAVRGVQVDFEGNAKGLGITVPAEMLKNAPYLQGLTDALAQMRNNLLMAEIVA